MSWRSRFDERNQRRADQNNARLQQRNQAEAAGQAPEDDFPTGWVAAEMGCCLFSGCVPFVGIAAVVAFAIAYRLRGASS